MHGNRTRTNRAINIFLAYQPHDLEIRAEMLSQIIFCVAIEYGVVVDSYKPCVTVDILNQQTGKFGARSNEYLVDELLGEHFIQCRTQHGTDSSFRLFGPPFSCELISES